ncbi:MAG: alpha/beta fold hydrolase [Propionibacteriales bacterium]|nr:alpha/beta fold hydrolase [Propionibacteriales bacterium]
MVAPDGVRLAVRTAGDPANPTLVCLHGYPDNKGLWDGVVDRMSDRYHVVAYDTRGAGESSKPRPRRAYRLDVLEADCAAVLDAASPDRPVHLLAHDWGSIQGWHFVTGDRLRGRIASFTSISGPCLDHAGLRLRMRNRGRGQGPLPRQLLKQVGMSWYIGFFQIPFVPELVFRSVGRIVLARIGRRRPSSTRPSSAAVDDYVYGVQLYRANMIPRLLRPEERRTTVPVQVIAPTRDRYVGVPLQTQVEQWAPNLRVHTVPSGHWLPRTRPDLVAELVTAHIEG